MVWWKTITGFVDNHLMPTFVNGGETLDNVGLLHQPLVRVHGIMVSLRRKCHLPGNWKWKGVKIKVQININDLLIAPKAKPITLLFFSHIISQLLSWRRTIILVAVLQPQSELYFLPCLTLMRKDRPLTSLLSLALNFKSQGGTWESFYGSAGQSTMKFLLKPSNLWSMPLMMHDSAQPAGTRVIAEREASEWVFIQNTGIYPQAPENKHAVYGTNRPRRCF